MLNTMASSVILLIALARIACSDRHTDIHTRTRDNYCNLLCACAPRVNNSHFEEEIPNTCIYPPELTLRELVSQIPNCSTWIFKLVRTVSAVEKLTNGTTGILLVRLRCG